IHRIFFIAKMIEGGNPRHICIDLTHFTSQSKIFDTAVFLQSACQVLLMVSKFRNIETIGISTKCDGDITALSLGVKNFIYFVDISFAPKFLYCDDDAKLMPIFVLRKTPKKTRKCFLALKYSEMVQSIYDRRLPLI
ncbi:MAG: hypothetical protein VW456_09755, partial [Alphaproteobacteria bacterium]